MHDFEYDVREKKRLARNAFNRKNGSHSKSCSLPSDRMTEAQWKKRNGAVMNYDLKQPMNWAQFASMPTEIQEEYLRRLSERYHVTIRCMADLFGVSWETVSRYLKANHPWMKFKRGNAMSNEDKAGFAEFLCGSQPVAEEPLDEEPQEPYDEKKEAAGFRMRSLVAEFETLYEPGAVNNMILAMMPSGLTGNNVRIRIEIDIM